MVVDCEYVHSHRTFVVFDLFRANNRPMCSDYRQRLRELSALALPVLSGYTVRVKTVYPICALSEKWYEQQCSDELAVDGIIIHDGAGTIDAPLQSFKWKPMHTVDLYVGSNGVLMDGSYTPFLSVEDGYDLKTKGEIWECSIHGTRVRPIRQRTDKCRANARHVCYDILRAHRESLSIADVIRIAHIAREPVRKSKRKRGAT